MTEKIDEEYAWRLAAELVRIESTDPGVYEGEIEQHIKSLVEQHVSSLPQWLVDAVEVRELEALPGRRDLMVRLAGTGEEPALVYSCHMDTVTIGDGCVIGAGSVVTKDIPANVVAVGNPCRVLREISDHDREFYFKDRRIDWSEV